MQQDDLTDLLRNLARVGASPGFEEAVASRLRQRRARRMQLRIAMGVLLMLAVSAGGFSVHHRRVTRVQAARREQVALAHELAELKAQSAKFAPILLVGRTAGADYVIDLRKPADQALQRTSSTY